MGARRRCCCNQCPDCTAPIPETTGNTSAGVPWYLTTTDPPERASFQYNTLETTAYPSIFDSIKLRHYFAYENANNHCYVEVYTSSNKLRVETWEVTNGTTNQLGNFTSPAPVGNYFTFFNFGLVSFTTSITYDEATATARVVVALRQVLSIMRRYYAKFTINQTTAKGIKYGWGWGAKGAFSDAQLNALTWSVAAYRRHIDYCQGFPHVIQDIVAPTWAYHPVKKTTQFDTATIVVTGVVGCGSYGSAINDTIALSRREWEYMTFDGTGAPLWVPSTLASDEIDDGCEYITNPNTWGCPSPDPFNIQFRLVFETGIARLEAWQIGRLIPNAPICDQYPYRDRTLIGYSEKSFATTCDQYAGTVLDGLVFDDWTTSGDAQYPDFTNAEATLTL